MTGSDKRKPELKQQQVTQKKFCSTQFRFPGEPAGTACALYGDITQLISADGENPPTQLPQMCVSNHPDCTAGIGQPSEERFLVLPVQPDSTGTSTHPSLMIRFTSSGRLLSNSFLLCVVCSQRARHSPFPKTTAANLLTANRAATRAARRS